MGPYEQGDSAKGHSHTIDHCMNLVRGSVSIQWETPDGETGTVDALVPCKILIKAECSHLITALEADTYWECWFSEAECEKEHGTTDLPWHV